MARLSMSCLCALGARQANGILGCIGKSIGSRLRELIYACTLVRPYLECCVQFWTPQDKKDMELLEQVQRRTTRMSRVWLLWGGTEGVGPVQPWQENIERRYISIYKYLKGGCWEDEVDALKVVFQMASNVFHIWSIYSHLEASTLCDRNNFYTNILYKQTLYLMEGPFGFKASILSNVARLNCT